ncbi:MAG: DUF2344 domain-containing protein [Myxococcales bacterium]|nr:DUF2344 domain-containing protein [Myxococcales bacterium]
MFDLYKHPYRDALLRWHRAHLLVAGEAEALSITPNDGDLRIVLLLPVREETTYQDLQSWWLYQLLNAQEGVQVERAIALPKPDASELAEQGEPLRSMESATPLASFDIAFVLLDQTHDIFHMMRVLEQAQIPRDAQERAQAAPKSFPKLYGLGRLAPQAQQLSVWLDDFLLGDLWSSLALHLPVWKHQKAQGLPLQVEAQDLPPSQTWPSQLMPSALSALTEEKRSLLWAFGQWHIQGCPFCRDALLQKTGATVLSEMFQGLIDTFQPGPQTPAWERWEMWLQRAHQDAEKEKTRSFGGTPPKRTRKPQASKVPPPTSEAPETQALIDNGTTDNGTTDNGATDNEPSTLPKTREEQDILAIRSLGLDRWMDRMLYRQGEWALCMALASYPRGLGGSQQEAEAAWYNDDISILPWMWRRRLTQRQTRIPIDILLGTPNDSARESLAWSRLARKAKQISQVYQKGSRVKLFLHPRLPLPQTEASASPSLSHEAWKREIEVLGHFAEVWDFRIKAPHAWQRTFATISWREVKGFPQLAEMLYQKEIDRLEETEEAEALWQEIVQAWSAKQGQDIETLLAQTSMASSPSTSQALPTDSHCQACATPHTVLQQTLQVMEAHTTDFLQGIVPAQETIAIPQNPNQNRCRLHFARTGYATLMTQKDFLPMLHANFRRSGLPFMREGSDTIVSRFAPDLPLGTSSVAEYVDLSFVRMPDLSQVLERLQEHAIQGLTFLAIAPLHARLLGISKIISAWEYFCPFPQGTNKEALCEKIEALLDQPFSFSRKDQTYPVDLRKIVSSWKIREGRTLLPSSWDAWQGEGLSLIVRDFSGKSPRPIEIFSYLFGESIPSWKMVRIESGRLHEGELFSPMQDADQIFETKRRNL